MIHSIKSNKSSFRTVEFKKGFNVILAERTKESTKKDSRNGLGKSTLIEIIHFCLGSNKGETLKKKEMEEWSFTLDVDISGKRYSITRNTSSTNKIIVEGDCLNWPIKPSIDKKTGEPILSRNNWTKVLGMLMFGLDATYGDIKYVPTFRSLISYIVRRNGQRGAFLNPFQHYKNQKEWDIQANNAYILGLGWEYASRWQILKDRVKVVNQIKSEAQSGILTDIMGTLGQLESQKIRLESQVKQGGINLKDYKVHPQYNDIEAEVNDSTAALHKLVNDNISDKKLLEHYESSLTGEIEANSAAVKKIYEEAGVVLSDLVTKRLDDVLAFHEQVVKNRKDFLKTEMRRLKNKVANREKEKQEISDRKAELMSILQSHGALEEYTNLQSKHQKTVARFEELNNKINNLKKFEEGKSAITVDTEILQQEASTDMNERSNQKEKAVLLFNANSEALYDAPGILSIDISKTGFKYGVAIERSGSHGIGNMKIFCYDLMIANILCQRNESPGFLIHDSILFADVDERQKALALQLATKESNDLGFQYICTMNSDNVPQNDFSDDFKFDSHVRMTLTDSSDDGGILGIRF